MRMRNWLGAAVAAGVTAALVAGPGATAGHEPADKTSASGSTTEVLEPRTSTPILSETIRTSTPSDLILGVTAECAITTELQTVGNDTANTFGEVRMYVTIDGVPVPISDDDTDNGRVVFCNRAESRTTSLFDDTNATIDTFQEERQANGFNWMALDVGNGIHKIEVWAEFTQDEDASDGGSALAAVGNRTLIVEPTKAANDEAITELG